MHKTKKSFYIWFPYGAARRDMIRHVERRAGGKGAAGLAAAQRTLAAEHRSAIEKADGRRNGNQMPGIPVASL